MQCCAERTGLWLVVLLGLVVAPAVLAAPGNRPIDLALELQQNAPLRPGVEGMITLVITNNGSVAVTGEITVTAWFPDLLTYLAANPRWAADLADAPTFTWTMAGQLAPGQSEVLDLQVVAAMDIQAPLAFSASVASSATDSSPDNNHLAEFLAVDLSLPQLATSCSLRVIQDPVNDGANPKAIPGATILYTVVTANQGPAAIDQDTVELVHPIPDGTALLLTDLAGPGSGPVLFQDGIPSSGLSYRFRYLRTKGDGLEFSNNGGMSFNYTPTPDGQGADSAVTHLRIKPRGVFQGLMPEGAPNFSIQLQVLLQ